MHYSPWSTPQSKGFLWSFKTLTDVHTHTCHPLKSPYFSRRVTRRAGRVSKSPARCTTIRGGQWFILLTMVTTTKLVILGAYRYNNKATHPRLPKLSPNFSGLGQQTGWPVCQVKWGECPRRVFFFLIHRWSPYKILVSERWKVKNRGREF